MRRTALEARGAALLLSLATAACSLDLGSPAAILGPEAYPPAMVLATGTTGEDCATTVLFVPLDRPTLDEAVRRALATVPEATLLTDARVELTGGSVGIYGRTCIRVRGSAAKLVRSVSIPGGHEGHGAHH